MAAALPGRSARFAGTFASILVAGAGCSQLAEWMDYTAPLSGEFVIVLSEAPGASSAQVVIPVGAEAIARVDSQEYPWSDGGAVNDAAVQMVVDDVGAFVLTKTSMDGMYQSRLIDDPALYYASGKQVRVHVDTGEASGSVTAPASPPAEFDFPELVTAGKDLEVSLLNGPYTAIALRVFGADGVETWSDYPDTLNELAELQDSDGRRGFRIPGEAFPAPASTYAVGVTGLLGADQDAYDGINPAETAFLVGTTRWVVVYTD